MTDRTEYGLPAAFASGRISATLPSGSIGRHAFMTDADNRITSGPKGDGAREHISAKIYPVAAHEQGALFTGLPVPIDELMKRQGINGPQGLAAFADPEWELDQESERFLEAIFAESDSASSGASAGLS